MYFSSGILLTGNNLLFMMLKLIYRGFPSLKARPLTEFLVDSEAVCYIVICYQFVQGWSPPLLEENVYFPPANVLDLSWKAKSFSQFFGFLMERLGSSLLWPMTQNTDDVKMSSFPTSLWKPWHAMAVSCNLRERTDAGFWLLSVVLAAPGDHNIPLI